MDNFLAGEIKTILRPSLIFYGFSNIFLYLRVSKGAALQTGPGAAARGADPGRIHLHSPLHRPLLRDRSIHLPRPQLKLVDIIRSEERQKELCYYFLNLWLFFQFKLGILYRTEFVRFSPCR